MPLPFGHISFSTVVDNVLIVLLGGLLMGGIVLTIDRVLIAGMQGTGQNKKTGPIIFRVALALCLGAFMAQPALLYLFKKDIDVQLTFDQEVKKQQTVAEVKRSLLPQMAPLLAQRDSLAGIQNALDTQTLKLRSSFLAETDGSGGTGKVGIAAIAKAKKTEYDLALQQSTYLSPPLPHYLLRSIQSWIRSQKSRIIKSQLLTNKLVMDF
ncbi:MAG: DUF4407 domain-containing protein [Saprospiraceae bacterium]|nr:DUF4407 domain-containing protein [Candidatus Brachybacter algidus]